MSLPRYAEYKDSGVEWLGYVPAYWDVRRLGHYFAERREKVSDKDFPPLSVTKNGIVPQLETAAKTDDGDNRKLVRVDDLVINSRSDRKGSSGASKLDGSVSLINTVLRSTGGIATRFAHHLFRSVPFQEEYYRFGKGIVADLWSTNYSEMRNISLAVPEIAEQVAIAEFIDRETAKIDALIAEQEKLLTLLAEKRQATISHAVTRGLDPNAPMRDSGIPWLGQVPAHWEICPVKTVSEFTTSGPRGWSERIGDEGSTFVQSGDLNDSLGVDFYGAKHVVVGDDAEAQRTRIREGDVLVCITGAKTGNVAVCRAVPEEAYINQHLCLIRPNDGVFPAFLAIALKSRVGQTQFELSQYGLKQGLSLENVRDLLVVLPPIKEQREIASYLDVESRKFDALTIEIEIAIKLLRERRAALISAAVTGKIDVRGLVQSEAA